MLKKLIFFFALWVPFLASAQVPVSGSTQLFTPAFRQGAHGQYVENPLTGNRNLIPYALDLPVRLEWFIANLQDTSVDHAAAIAAVITNYKNVEVTKGLKVYTKSTISVSKLSGFKITFEPGGAILCKNNEVPELFIDSCSNFEIKNGLFDRPSIPTGNSKSGSAVAILVANSQFYTIEGTHIKHSPEMGINNTDDFNGRMVNVDIDSCYRDAIYSHYSANMDYISCHARHIKDDAFSFHDYGLSQQRTYIQALGYGQAYGAHIVNCTAKNVYQAFSSVQGSDIKVDGLIADSTVNAGVMVANVSTQLPGGTATFNNVIITNCIMTHTNNSVKIMGVVYNDYGQASSGRAAYWIGSQYVAPGTNYGTMFGAPQRGRNVTITNNLAEGGGEEGFECSNVDGLVFIGNTTRNCNNNQSQLPFPLGYMDAFWNCTDVNVDVNNVIDTRKPALHVIGAYYNATTGKDGQWNIQGFTYKDLAYEESKGLFPYQFGGELTKLYRDTVNNSEIVVDIPSRSIFGANAKNDSIRDMHIANVHFNGDGSVIMGNGFIGSDALHYQIWHWGNLRFGSTLFYQPGLAGLIDVDTVGTIATKKDLKVYALKNQSVATVRAAQGIAPVETDTTTNTVTVSVDTGVVETTAAAAKKFAVLSTSTAAKADSTHLYGTVLPTYAPYNDVIPLSRGGDINVTNGYINFLNPGVRFNANPIEFHQGAIYSYSTRNAAIAIQSSDFVTMSLFSPGAGDNLWLGDSKTGDIIGFSGGVIASKQASFTNPPSNSYQSVRLGDLNGNLSTLDAVMNSLVITASDGSKVKLNLTPDGNGGYTLTFTKQ